MSENDILELGDNPPQAAEGEPEEVNTVEYDLYEVEVTKSPEMKVRVEVPEHEIPILEVVHGKDFVQVVEPREGVEPLTTLLPQSVDDEWTRLEAKYDRKGRPSPVRTAYPMGAEQLRKQFGFGKAKPKKVSAGPDRRREVAAKKKAAAAKKKADKAKR